MSTGVQSELLFAPKRRENIFSFLGNTVREVAAQVFMFTWRWNRPLEELLEKTCVLFVCYEHYHNLTFIISPPFPSYIFNFTSPAQTVQW